MANSTPNSSKPPITTACADQPAIKAPAMAAGTTASKAAQSTAPDLPLECPVILGAMVWIKP